MKKIAFIITVLFAAANVFAQTGEVEITVSGINVKKGGIIKIGIYKKADFPMIGKEIKGKDIEVKNTQLTVNLKDIPVGTYAVAVIQDKNSDGEHNSNLFGSPTEAYGFSNNVYGRFGPPDFEDVSFNLQSGESISLTINIE